MRELKSKHKEAAPGEWSDLAESCQNWGTSPGHAKPAGKTQQGWCVGSSGCCVLPWHGLGCPDVCREEDMDRGGCSWAG